MITLCSKFFFLSFGAFLGRTCTCRQMEKPRRLLIILMLMICCFLLLTLLYADFYGSSVVAFYQRVPQVTILQLSTIEDAETREVKKSKQLQVQESGPEILQEHDSRQVSHSSSKVQEPRTDNFRSREKQEALQERESWQVSQSSRKANEIIELQDSRPRSLEKNKENPQEHKSRQVQRKSRDANETVSIELTKSSKSWQVGQSSREANEIIAMQDSRSPSLEKNKENPQEHKSCQVQQKSGHANETVSMELTKSSREELNGTVTEQMIKQPPKLLKSKGEASETIQDQDSRESLFTRLVRGEDRTKLEATGFACDTAMFSVVCVSRKPVTIDLATMTVHIPTDQTVEPNHTIVRPYARQDDKDLLRTIRPVQIFLGNTTPPPCQYNHNVPAVIFSSNGFTGNLFHEFNEIIIPLFLTTYHFQSQVQFILMDYKATFANKYRSLMSRLSSYEVLNPAVNPNVHCFSEAVAGLRYHDNLKVNSSEIPGGYTMQSFREFLRKTYRLKNINVLKIKKPRLMFLSRRGTRSFMNEAEMVRMMKDLGFEVIVARKPDKMSNLNKFARVVNSCTVLIGTHGAGLANELFLPDGAVMVQIDPLGLGWASAFFYGNPAEAMGLHYLRYKIEPEESTLLDIYGKNHPAITDPASIHAKGYQAARAVYLDQQNMKINIARLRETLLEALRITGFSSPQTQ